MTRVSPSLCLGHMRITGFPGSYGPIQLENPYMRVIRGMPVRNWTSCDVLVTCKRVVYGFSTGFLQFRDDVLAKGSQEPVRLPYGACTGPYGACARIVRTRTCLRTTVEFYDHCTWPVRVAVMAESAHTSSWPRTTAYVPSTEEKDVHAQLSDTGCLRVYRTITHGSLECWPLRCL